jgi:hypothetical protein
MYCNDQRYYRPEAPIVSLVMTFNGGIDGFMTLCHADDVFWKKTADKELVMYDLHDRFKVT